eukprot:gene12340-biopygen408
MMVDSDERLDVCHVPWADKRLQSLDRVCRFCAGSRDSQRAGDTSPAIAPSPPPMMLGPLKMMLHPLKMMLDPVKLMLEPMLDPLKMMRDHLELVFNLVQMEKGLQYFVRQAVLKLAKKLRRHSVHCAIPSLSGASSAYGGEGGAMAGEVSPARWESRLPAQKRQTRSRDCSLLSAQGTWQTSN